LHRLVTPEEANLTQDWFKPDKIGCNNMKALKFDAGPLVLNHPEI
jgi:hypothetical protein